MRRLKPLGAVENTTKRVVTPRKQTNNKQTTNKPYINTEVVTVQ
jgi:hypothetical protein